MWLASSLFTTVIFLWKFGIFAWHFSLSLLLDVVNLVRFDRWLRRIISILIFLNVKVQLMYDFGPIHISLLWIYFLFSNSH